jgi:hypothetical protein
MARPGVEVTVRDAAPPRSAPVGIDAWFVTGISEKGDATAPVLVRGFSEFQDMFGSRLANSLLYDSLDTFFREGGTRAYVSRVVGPSPVKAGVTLVDGSAGNVLRVDAKDYGSYGNSLNVTVVAAGSDYTITITHDTLGTLETSPLLADKQAAIDWSASSSYVRISSAGVSVLDPAAVAAASFTGGTDDSGNAVEANWTAALARFTSDLGPGQVSAPGRTTSAAQLALLAHAASQNRVALIDPVSGGDKATLIAAAAALRSDSNARYGAMFGPWAQVPGIVAGTLRSVPYSAVQAGLMARQVRANEPAAGFNGRAQYAVGLVTSFVDTDREDLNEAGVNIARVLNGGVTTYGYRTLVSPTGLPGWLSLGATRLVMEAKGKFEAIGEQFAFAQIDGEGRVFAKLGGQLTGVCINYYEEQQLYGATPQDAFAVDTGEAVNTPTTIAAGDIRAVVYLKVSPFAELVRIDIVKKQITEALV